MTEEEQNRYIARMLGISYEEYKAFPFYDWLTLMLAYRLASRKDS